MGVEGLVLMSRGDTCVALEKELLTRGDVCSPQKGEMAKGQRGSN